MGTTSSWSRSDGQRRLKTESLRVELTKVDCRGGCGRTHWAQSGLAAAQPDKLALRSVSSHSRNVETSPFSAKWPKSRTFDCLMRSFDERRRNDRSEPKAEVLCFYCSQMQQKTGYCGQPRCSKKSGRSYKRSEISGRDVRVADLPAVRRGAELESRMNVSSAGQTGPMRMQQDPSRWRRYRYMPRAAVQHNFLKADVHAGLNSIE